MIRFVAALALLAAALTHPARAQDSWRHEASGVSIARQVGDMQLNQERDASGGGNHDVILQFGEGPTAVTLYVYRSAYPNPALWFERTRMAMNVNVGSPGSGVDPRSITLGGASAPNGLREDIGIPAGGQFRATSVAIAQVGEWIVKARISSQTLDRDAVAARMDQLLGALRFERMPAPHPLLVPGPCSDEVRMRGRRLNDAGAQALAAAGLYGVVALTHARGGSGLAADPSGWCREDSEIPAQYAAIYRDRGGEQWVALVGDSGRAVAAMRLEGSDDGRAATYVSIPASTSIAALYDGLPAPDEATVEALPILLGQARGLVEISTQPDRGGNEPR